LVPKLVERFRVQIFAYVMGDRLSIRANYVPVQNPKESTHASDVVLEALA